MNLFGRLRMLVAAVPENNLSRGFPFRTSAREIQLELNFREINKTSSLKSVVLPILGKDDHL